MNKVTYKCEGCGEDFEVPQGSWRKYCDKCAIKRILHKESEEVK